MDANDFIGATFFFLDVLWPGPVTTAVRGLSLFDAKGFGTAVITVEMLSDDFIAPSLWNIFSGCIVFLKLPEFVFCGPLSDML